jgi:hypothetical protein
MNRFIVYLAMWHDDNRTIHKGVFTQPRPLADTLLAAAVTAASNPERILLGVWIQANALLQAHSDHGVLPGKLPLGFTNGGIGCWILEYQSSRSTAASIL